MNRTSKNRVPVDLIASDNQCGCGPCGRPFATTPLQCFHPRVTDKVNFNITPLPPKPIKTPGKSIIGSMKTSLSANDVLLGRGKNNSCRTGNLRFLCLVANFQPMYLLLRRREKPKMARSIVIIVRQKGGRFLNRVGGDGNDNINGEFLYEVEDKIAEKKTAQALRENLDVRAKESALKHSLNRREKVDVGGGMVAECQELRDEGAAIALRLEEETTRVIIGEDPQATRYNNTNCNKYYQSGGSYDSRSSSFAGRRGGTPPVTLPSGFEPSLLQGSCNRAIPTAVHHLPVLANSIISSSDAPPHSFVSGQGPQFVASPPSVLLNSPPQISLTQWHYNRLNNDCCRPMHCNNSPPSKHGHGGNLPHAHPQGTPAAIGSTLLSSSVTDHPGRSDWDHQGLLRTHSFDDGEVCLPPLASDPELAVFFDTPCIDLMSSSNAGTSDDTVVWG